MFIGSLNISLLGDDRGPINLGVTECEELGLIQL
jgi:hypothetical protein